MAKEEKFLWWKISTHTVYNRLKTHTKYVCSAQGAEESYLTVIPVKFTIQNFVVRIDLLLIQITVRDQTVNMRSCYMSVEILSA